MTTATKAAVTAKATMTTTLTSIAATMMTVLVTVGNSSAKVMAMRLQYIKRSNAER